MVVNCYGSLKAVKIMPKSVSGTNQGKTNIAGHKWVKL